MKKVPFTLPFKSNFFKEQDPFHLVVVFFIIFFGTAIFFSVPTFYNYEKYNQQIKKTINIEYKINIHNLENISFRFIPSPHLLIKNADLKIQENEKSIISELKNIKVFISITDLYKDDKFKIKKIEINRANFYLNNLSLKNFILNLKKQIVNNLIINKSTLFFKDKKDEIILISKIKNLIYKIDFVNNKKILKINGNLFDSNYTFSYLIDYNEPNVQNIKIKFNNPDLTIENILTEDFLSKNLKQEANLTLEFLNKKNEIYYEVKNNNIKIFNKNLKNSIFDLKGDIKLNPFYFDLMLDIKSMDLLEMENLAFLLFKSRKTNFENLSGKIKINFNDLNNKIINKGSFESSFINSSIYLDNKIFDLNQFATFEVRDYEYLESGNQVLQAKILLKVLDQEKFNRFIFNYRKNKNIPKKIYFTYQFNSDTGDSFISTISKTGFSNYNEFYKFRNFQQLKNLLRDEKIFKLD